MDEYIERGTAVEAAKHAWSKGLEPSQYIEIIPAADVKPVRHGRWITVGVNYYTRISQCTNCCAKYDFRSKYCPNCGARMDEEGE